MDNELALLPDGPLVDARGLTSKLGWSLKPQGLCRDETCVIVPPGVELEQDGQIDVLGVAALLDRPALVHQPSGVAAVGAPRQKRRDALDLKAPDFVLPDLDGTPHALSDHRSKKRLLVAFSSW